ncbi:Ficolin-1 [Holothuria leucospilota]|uniref:Ficolin-1 n=1 Tax=Holothuria leucospilota TaxID=206669 RepID=A0A9Q1CKQ6_HOLLE|nr:Ficolin-1 [Holothuria leucospilota]
MKGNSPCLLFFMFLWTFWMTPSALCDLLPSGYVNIQISSDGAMQVLLSDIGNGPPLPAKDCSQLLQEGVTTSGVYRIQPVTYPQPFYVYCDMETEGGGWTIIQKRLDGSVGFYRGWEDYKEGFGNINSEYWLGNEKLFYLTAQGDYRLRVDLKDFEGETRYATYDKFRIGDETTFYKLMLGVYSGNAGDSLRNHNNTGFSTKDADNDSNANGNCAVSYKGAWWYTECHSSNLNGLYHGGGHESYADGVNWSAWRGYYYSLKATEMKIRREA